MIYISAINLGLTTIVLVFSLVYRSGRFTRSLEADGQEIKSLSTRIDANHTDLSGRFSAHDHEDKASFTKIETRLTELAYKMQRLPYDLRALFLPKDVSDGIETATVLKLDRIQADVRDLKQDIDKLWERRSGRERRNEDE